MPTLKAALDAFECHLGFPKSRTVSVARRLQDDRILPLGTRGDPPRIDEDNFVDLFIAIAADNRLRSASANARTYGALSPGGAVIPPDAPANIDRTARDYLNVLLELALRGGADGDSSGVDQVRRSFIEVVQTWPEISVRDADGVKRFTPVGTTAGHWQNAQHYQSRTINGAAFVRAARHLFLGE